MTREWWNLPSTVVSADPVFFQAHLTPGGGQHSCLNLCVSLVMLGAPVPRVQTHNFDVGCLYVGHFPLQPCYLVTMLVETRPKFPLSKGL